MKSINEIINSFKASLASLNSPLANFTSYSNIYMIIRSISNVIVEQYMELDKYYTKSFLYSSNSNDLDLRAKDFNLDRGTGSYATGFVFATSNVNTFLIKGTILNSVESNYQFQTTESLEVTSLGVYIPITSLITSELANLNSGIVLTSTFYPNVKFVIAQSVDLLGNYIGSLQGGRSVESDYAFKTRITNHINNLTRGTLTSVINQLNELNLTKIFIKEGYPVTGYFTIYVDTVEQTLIDLIESEIMIVKPIGTSFEIKPIQTEWLNLRFVLTVTSSEFVESISNSIREICYNYFEGLDLGQEIYSNNILILCSNIQGIVDIRLTEPTMPRLVPPNDTLFKINNIDLTINTGV